MTAEGHLAIAWERCGTVHGYLSYDDDPDVLVWFLWYLLRRMVRLSTAQVGPDPEVERTMERD
jgi:hypothetical protein